MNPDVFWGEDVDVLWSYRDEIMPQVDMTTNQKLNALSRLVIVCGLFIGLIHSLQSGISTIAVGLSVTYLVYLGRGEHGTFNVEGFLSTVKKNFGYTGPIGVTDMGDVCQMPTPDNPYANPLPGDNPIRPPACSRSDPEVAQSQDYYTRMFQNLDDVWTQAYADRQFYTLPSTTNPNDRDALTKWCFGNLDNCKSGHLDHCDGYGRPQESRREINYFGGRLPRGHLAKPPPELPAPKFSPPFFSS